MRNEWTDSADIQSQAKQGAFVSIFKDKTAIFQYVRITTAVLAVMITTACATPSSKELAAPESTARATPLPSAQPPSGKGWNASMFELSKTLSRLLPLLSASDLSQETTDREEVLRLSRKLADNAHRVDRSKSAPSADPVLRFIARDFRGDTIEVITQMERGEWRSAQTKLMNATRYCIACHTLQPAAASDLTSGFKPDLSRLDHLKQADFYAAIRQFEQAIIHYENGLVSSEWANANEARWNDGFKKLLAVSVRTKNNPSLTMELISRFFDSRSYPQHLKENALLWRQQAKEWRGETTIEPTLEKAQKLVNRAGLLLRQRGDSAGLLLYLRASSLTHTYLIANGTNQRALDLAGQAAEGLANLNFWTFPEDYYAACVKVDAQSLSGKSCAHALERMKATRELNNKIRQ